jgi:multiple sugar transport system permease protein
MIHIFSFWKNLPELTPGKLAVLLNIPAFLFIFSIITYPLGYAFFLAFHKVGLSEMRSGEMPFAGLRNFIFIFTDPVFWLSLKQTMIFVATVVSLELILGLVIAIIFDKSEGKISTLMRTVMLVPWAVPPIVNALIWKYIYSSKYGILNALLIGLGFTDTYISWLGDSNLALYSVAFAYVWRTTPFSILLLYAALQGIPREIYEAGEVDGCNGWQKFRFITFPLLIPPLIIVAILRTTWAFQVFAEIFGMTDGGPENSTWVAAYYSYRYAFQPPLDIGVGAASAFLLALIISIFACFYIWGFRKFRLQYH